MPALTALTITPQTRRLIRRNPNVAATSRGIGEFGVYAEFLNLNSAGGVYEVIRMFAARDMLCTYQRRVSDTRTVWRGNRSTTVSAIELMQNRTKQLNRLIMRGAPMLVQLEPSDVDQLSKGVMPNARYRGSAAFEKMHGVLPSDLRDISVNEVNDTKLKAVASLNALVGMAAPAAAPTAAPATTAAPTFTGAAFPTPKTATAPVALDDDDDDEVEDEDIDYGDEPF